MLPNACRTCGVILEDGNRRHCDVCLPEVKARIGEELRTPALEALKRLREQGRDPSHGGEAAEKRAATLVARREANQAWEAELHPELDGVDFAQDIWPRIRSVPVRQLANATGLSVIYCSKIRSDGTVPHPRHWTSLRSIMGPD